MFSEGGPLSIGRLSAAALPEGRYYFAVVVHSERARAMLAAGEADLTR